MALGPVLGVGVIVGAFGILHSTEGELRAALERLGVNLITVDALGGENARLPGVAAERAASIPTVTGVVGLARVSASASATAPGGDVGAPPIANDVFAVSDDLFSVLGLGVSSGRRIGAVDDAHTLPVAVLGLQVARNVGFEAGSPQVIYVGSQPLAVVGVLERSVLVSELNFAILVPSSTASTLLGASPAPARLIVAVKAGTAALTASLLPSVVTFGGPGELQVRFPAELLAAQVEVDRTVTTAIFAIGFLAMLVGAFGIANVMMIAVLERRREIGVRRALGHTRLVIGAQFVIESAILGVIGASAGALAAAAIVLVTSVVAGWVVVMQPGTALIALAAGFTMTVLASLYPASRAAAMEPLDALRSE
jgi:putative ABC transport system permease protein